MSDYYSNPRESSPERGSRRSSRKGSRSEQPASAPAQPRARVRFCVFCVEKVDYIDYKKPELLASYLSNSGKIAARRRSGVCAKHQRGLATAIKRARFLALLPHTAEHIRLSGMKIG
ncbi:MAG: 30S ribosomal protein S18 [Caldilineales bacterium]|nr:30S ribosomal protein S18 [Caldilineales bacterium]